ncbi:MAG: hypothetical protein K2O18_05205, partial [Oscillospiraceae bacterium]|nr:hypothetical protein [Oscillospiraceae bacterium]
YKMALIGEQEAESPDESGFEESFPAVDYTGTVFYALSFVIQLDSTPGTEFQEIRVLDAATSEDLTAASGSALHVYYGEVPCKDYTAAHPVKSAPVISSAVSDELITCVFVSLEKKEIGDLKVILIWEDNAAEGGTEAEVNSQLEEIDANPLYTMGNSLLKLGDQYYVSESGTGIGAIPGENKYVTRKIRCVSLPLTGAAPGLDASSAALFDKTTGEKAEPPEGTKVYYKEDHKENQDLTAIEFGIRMSGGSYEEAELFMDAVLPGYELDGRPLMF